MGKTKKRLLGLGVVTAVVALCAIGVMWFFTLRGPPGPPQNDMSVDMVMRTEVIESAIASLDRSYVFPEKAVAVATQLRAQMQRGEFDAINSAKAFAQALSAALQRETHDKHLQVSYFETPIAESFSDEQNSPDELAAEQLRGTRLNFGFENVDRLHGNIGYIDLTAFARPQGAAERIAAAMSLLGDTSALIIDLRDCGGGDPDTVMLLASYLFDKPTHLNDIYWREGDHTEQRWTTASVPGKSYGEARKVYLLTSDETFSAAEDFAYALKNAGRAIVVGETTGGGAHPGNRHRLNAHFMLNVPNGRAINPVTHTDWESTGVTPDVAVAAPKALDTAHIAILKALIASETDLRWKTKLEHMLGDLL